VIDLLTRHPVVDAEMVARELGVAAANTYSLLNRLEEQGIVKSRAEYRSVKLWRSDEILTRIDKFAERAGRRD